MSTGKKEWLDTGLREKYIKSIPFSQFRDVNLVTRGGFGEVSSAWWPSGQRKVALKSLKSNSDVEDPKAWEEFVRELRLVRSVDHNDNIIRFFGVSCDTEKQRHYLVFEYANGGTLRDYLQANVYTINWDNRIRIAKEIASGLLGIHSESIVHRDLHSKNVLVNNGHMKIADYGLSKALDETSLSPHGGMVAYCDPAYLKDQSYKRERSSDIYAFGVLMWEISSCVPPFSNIEPFTLPMIITRGEREKPVAGTPNDYLELYQDCWNGEPSERPTIEEVSERLEKVSGRLTTNELPRVRIWMQDEAQSAGNSQNTRDHSHLTPMMYERDSMSLATETNTVRTEFHSFTSRNDAARINNCKDVCARFKARFQYTASIPSCHPGYHVALGDTDGLPYHIYNDCDVNSVYGPSSIYTQNMRLLLIAAQSCPADRILDVFNTLFSLRLDISQQLDDQKSTTFHWMCENPSLLESSKIEVNSSSKVNYFLEVTRWLIAKDVDINLKDTYGRTALSRLVEKQYPHAVEIFLNSRANPNVYDSTGYTALHWVLRYDYQSGRDDFKARNTKVVKLLLEHGARPDLPVSSHSSPASGRRFANSLFLAIHFGWPGDVLQLLIDKGANTADLDNNLNALAYAAKRNRHSSLKFLMENVEQFRNVASINSALSETQDAECRAYLDSWYARIHRSSLQRNSNPNDFYSPQ